MFDCKFDSICLTMKVPFLEFPFSFFLIFINGLRGFAFQVHRKIFRKSQFSQIPQNLYQRIGVHGDTSIHVQAVHGWKIPEHQSGYLYRNYDTSDQ